MYLTLYISDTSNKNYQAVKVVGVSLSLVYNAPLSVSLVLLKNVKTLRSDRPVK
jgi:hypothetical protein